MRYKQITSIGVGAISALFACIILSYLHFSDFNVGWFSCTIFYVVRDLMSYKKVKI